MFSTQLLALTQRRRGKTVEKGVHPEVLKTWLALPLETNAAHSCTRSITSRQPQPVEHVGQALKVLWGGLRLATEQK